MRTSLARRSFTVLALVIAVVTLTGCDDLFAGGWGNNDVGQLGDLADGSTDVPVALYGNRLFAESTMVDVSAQEQSSCALASDGTAACWGRSTTAGVVTDSITPVIVDGSGLFDGKTITAVEAGAGLKCALTSDGMVGCWDQTGERRIDGVLTSKTVIDISVGDGHACALTIDAIVACWGDNSRGQLGDNTTVTRVDPVVVSNTGALVGRTPVAVTAGRRHTCALASDGTATCWGDNTLGQIGDGTQLTRCQPTAVASTGTASAWNLTGIDAGTSHTCAVTADGRTTCWGFNVAGQLGDGQTLTIGTTPQAVDTTGVIAGRSVVVVSAGGNHSCALLDDGSVACWGANFDGQLGSGSRTESAVPVAVSTLDQVVGGASLPVTGLDVGGAHSLAVYEANAPSEFVPIEPVRLLDTRTGDGQPLSSSQYVVVDTSGVVPPQATAIAFNITATGQTASGFFEVAPEGAPSGSSTINWSGPQQTIANGHITKLSAADTLRITLDSTGLAHGVLDITGYFVQPGAAGGSLLTTTDRRIYDSRLSDGPLPAGQSRVLTIAGGGNALPVTPTSAAINVTVTGTRGSGVLSVAETVTSATSTINWSAGAQTVANAVITPVSEAGTFTVTNNGTTPAEVVVDLTGVFGPASQGGAAFHAVNPARTYDSRLTNGELVAGQTRVVTNPVPDDAVAVAVNTTITGTSGTGFFTASPPQPIGADVSVAPPPPTSTVNWFTSPTTRANGSIIPVSRTALGGYTGGNYGSEYLFDVAGFFR